MAAEDDGGGGAGGTGRAAVVLGGRQETRGRVSKGEGQSMRGEASSAWAALLSLRGSMLWGVMGRARRLRVVLAVCSIFGIDGQKNRGGAYSSAGGKGAL